MAWLRVRDLALTAGDRVLVSGVTFRLDPGDRIGLVGPNGMGKTTLFRVLRGQTLPQAGRIEHSEDLSWASLDQLATQVTGTVWDVAYGANPHIAAWGHRLAELERRMASAVDPELQNILDEYADLQERFLVAGGYEWDARVRQALEGLGFSSTRVNDPADRLSGGERHRLALARVVLSGASIWLLDEPTNHLDVEALEWLERTLLQFSGAVLMASHDRRFLDRTATRIISWEDGSFFAAVGGYRQYAALRRQRLERLQDAWRRYQEERARLMAFVDRYRAGSRASQAKSRLHAIARLDRQAAPLPVRPRSAPHLATHGGQALTGTAAVMVDRLVLQIGDRTWDPVSFKLPTTARLGIAGPNGCGKTTLLGALARSAPGVHWNPDSTLVWYDQHAAETLPTAATGLELAHEEGMDREAAYSLGARFGLHAELMRASVGYWSGGERARLALLFALMAPANVLLLDEPTNHLDLPMREELEALLVRYPGVIVLVTHDRELLDRISTHSLLRVDQAFRFVPRPYSEAMASLGRAGA